MPRKTGFWSPAALANQNNGDEGDEGDEHAVPLLPNQEHTEDSQKSSEADHHVWNSPDSLWGQTRRLFGDGYASIRTSCQIHRKFICLFLIIVVLGTLFIKLFFGNGNSKYPISVTTWKTSSYL
jgi:hypothetical protein